MDWRSALFAALVVWPLLVSAQTAAKTQKPAHTAVGGRAAPPRHPAASRRSVPTRHAGSSSNTSAIKTSSRVVSASAGGATGRARRPSTTGSRGRGRNGHASTRIRRAAAPSYQLHPDPERYQEIQKTLADRGFYKGQPDGSWNDDSVQALRDFQSANQLEADGKINALTLMKLGLGPKHDGSGAPLSAVDALRSASKAGTAPTTVEPPLPPDEAPLPPPPTSLPTDAPTTPE